MNTHLVLSAILCVVVSISATTSETELDANNTVTVDRRAVPRQARFAFCLNGWFSFRGKCYFLANHFDTWANAENFCSNYGANLASIHSIWEYNFIQNMVKTGGHTFAWIGGFYFQNDWRWIDGSLFDYNNWSSLNSEDIYQCLQLSSQEYEGSSNQLCSTHSPFVCKVDPNC